MSTAARVRPTLPPGVDALLRSPQVAVALGISEREFRARRHDDFPAPDSPPGEHPKWRVSTVNAYIERRYGRGERASS